MKASKQAMWHPEGKVFLGTFVERGINSFEATNTGKPSMEDLEKFCARIQRGSYEWTNDLSRYSPVIEDHGCLHKEIKSTTPFLR